MKRREYRRRKVTASVVGWIRTFFPVFCISLKMKAKAF